MRTIKKTMLSVVAGFALSCGVATAGASAYSISGGAYTGTNSSLMTFSFDSGAYTFTCATATFSGNATGAASTAMTPAFSNCFFFGFAATVSQSGAWPVTIDYGPVGDDYVGSVDIPTAVTTTLDVPVLGCTVTFDGMQSFPGSTTLTDTSVGVDAEIDITGLWYSTSGCPFSSGSSGTLGGTLSVPGIALGP